VPSTPLELDRSSGHQPLRIVPTPDKLSITPASLLCLATIDRHAWLLAGHGIDWGSGSGLLAIAVATLPDVERVVGLEVEERDVLTARANAELNGVSDRTVFVHADLFDPLHDEDEAVVADLDGSADFLVANPPASVGDDGLGWRRAILREGHRHLRPGAAVLLQISRQYGAPRIEALAGHGYRYLGLLGSSDWVPFDLERGDLRQAIGDFAAEEGRSGMDYPFRDGEDDSEIDARTALTRWEERGVSPPSQWQVHRYERLGD
jgi:SAM-dependent methyltransferase